MPAMFLIGIDVGGTFTDLTAIDEATGRVVVTKVPSERCREASAVLAGLRAGEKVVASGQFLLDSEASLTGIAARPLAGDAR